MNSKPFYDFYQVLDIDSHFDPEKLAKAYKKLSLKYHPDLNSQGTPHFLVISEAYQTLKDSYSRNEYNRSLHLMKHLSDQYPTYKVKKGLGDHEEKAYQGSGFYHRTYTYDDFETIFKEFHRYHKVNHSIRRASQISGALGGILGGLMALLVLPIIFFLPGVIFISFLGYIMGRLHPQLAPILIKITNLVVLVAVFFLIAYSLFWGNIFFLMVIIICLYLYFSMSRSWEKELYRSNRKF